MADHKLAHAPHQYGSLERRIARLIGRFPRMKAWTKQAYARTAYHLIGGHDTTQVALGKLRKIGAPSTETFFGYYDKSPLSGHGWLLCHAARHPSHRRPRPQDSIAVQLFDFKAGECTQPVMSLSTRSYNWQQGARAHWLDDEHFIFNDFDPQERRYVSRLHSASAQKELRRYDHAVQDSWRREYFLAINYRRLQALRPEYGYCNLPPLDGRALASLDDDGIWRVEQCSGRGRLIYTLSAICRTGAMDDAGQARHKVNHLMIAPGGDRFIFLHRYFVGQLKFDRLMLAASDGSELRVLAANEMVSHCFWIDDATLLCYLRGPTGRDGYYTVEADTGQMKPLLDGALDTMGDGHPYVQGRRFVTDTYPDKRRMQHLILADLHSGAVTALGRFHQDFRYNGETRCDLHPRIAPDGRGVFFDSVCDGRRRLYFLELE